MRRFPALSIALVLLCLLAPALALGLGQPVQEQAAPERQRVAGTHVSLEVPSGFSRSASFSGYADVATGCAIIVQEIPGSVYHLLETFSDPEVLEARGMTVVDSKTLKNGDLHGLFLHIEQTSDGVDYGKSMWIFGTYEATAMVIGMHPVIHADTEAKRLEAAVLSALWVDGEVPDAQAALPFELLETPGLQVLSGLQGALMLTADGKTDEEKRGKPVFVCAPSTRPSTRDPKKQFKTRLIRSTIKNLEVGDYLPVTIDGLDGFACVASGEHKELGEPRFIYQVMLFEGPTYWLMQGIAAEEHREEYLPHFEQTAASFKRHRDLLTSVDGACTIKVPATWSMRSDIQDTANLQAGHQIIDSYIVVFSESKSEFAEGFTHLDHSASTRQWLEETATADWEAVNTRIGGMDAVVCEFHTRDEDGRFGFLHATIDGKNQFHQVLMWTTDRHYATTRSELEHILHSFREVLAAESVPTEDG